MSICTTIFKLIKTNRFTDHNIINTPKKKLRIFRIHMTKYMYIIDLRGLCESTIEKPTT